MATANVTRPCREAGLRVGVGVAAVAAIVAGLFGSAFAMWVVWLIDDTTAVIGSISCLRRVRWGLLLLAVGAGLLLGGTAYIGLGLIQPGDPPSGDGTGVVP